MRLSNGSSIAAAVADKVTPGATSSSTPAASSSLRLGCFLKNFARCRLYRQTPLLNQLARLLPEAATVGEQIMQI